jgi:hypothetical protein
MRLQVVELLTNPAMNFSANQLPGIGRYDM